MPRKKKDIVRPGYQERGKENETEQPPKKVRKATWDGFQDRTPAEIAEECRKFREGWSETERRNRAVDPALKETPTHWSVPVINIGSLECNVDGILPVDSCPFDVVDEMDPTTVNAERPRKLEDVPTYVRKILQNKGRRKAG